MRGWAAIRRIDFPGAALASAATICLLLGLTWGGQDLSLGFAAGDRRAGRRGRALRAFLLVERFAAEPVLPLESLQESGLRVGRRCSRC